jgi:hypothetical protein
MDMQRWCHAVLCWEAGGLAVPSGTLGHAGTGLVFAAVAVQMAIIDVDAELTFHLRARYVPCPQQLTRMTRCSCHYWNAAPRPSIAMQAATAISEEGWIPTSSTAEGAAAASVVTLQGTLVSMCTCPASCAGGCRLPAWWCLTQ